MTPTPTQIATQAAEQYFPEAPEGEAHYRECDVEELAALILSAAAKMVRESGAVAALQDMLLDGTLMGDHSTGETWPYVANYEQARAALHSLRSITGEAGK